MKEKKKSFYEALVSDATQHKRGPQSGRRWKKIYIYQSPNDLQRAGLVRPPTTASDMNLMQPALAKVTIHIADTKIFNMVYARRITVQWVTLHTTYIQFPA